MTDDDYEPTDISRYKMNMEIANSDSNLKISEMIVDLLKREYPEIFEDTINFVNICEQLLVYYIGNYLILREEKCPG